MSNVVLDATAILAVVFGETGCDWIEEQMAMGAMASSVSVAEVLAQLRALSMPTETIKTVVQGLALSIVPFDYAQAQVAAEIDAVAGNDTLSFPERAALALAKFGDYTAVTTNEAWGDIAGVIRVDVSIAR